MKKFIYFLCLWLLSNISIGQVCQPSYSSGSQYGDYISYVRLDTLISATGAMGAPYYAVQNGSQTTIKRGQFYHLVIAPGSFYSNYMAAWIDFNRNDTFEASEKLGQKNNMGNFALDSFEFQVPAQASLGIARLRVREVYNDQNIQPCSASTYGESEDYFITIDTSSQIQQGLPIQVTATEGANGPNDYPDLKTAIDSISQGFHRGIINILVKGNTQESDGIVLPASGVQQADYTKITITPSGGQARKIIYNGNKPLFLFDGADRVKIDGLNTVGNSLTFENQHNGTLATVFSFRNDACTDTLKRLTIKGSIQDTLKGIVSIEGSQNAQARGNDTIFISDCRFNRSAAAKPFCMISSGGIFSGLNDAINIDYNTITGFSQRAILFYGIGDKSKIILNVIHHEDSLSGNIELISVMDGTGVEISYNYLGYAEEGTSGFMDIINANSTFTGISLSSPDESLLPFVIEGNQIGNINLLHSQSGALTCIKSRVFGRININFNTIGDPFRVNSLSTNGNAPINGIDMYVPSGDSLASVSYNEFENITLNNIRVNSKFRGIVYKGSGQPYIVGNRFIDITNSTRYGGTWHADSAAIACIQVNNNHPQQDISDNRFEDLYAWGNTTQPISLFGIVVNGNGGGKMDANLLYNFNITSSSQLNRMAGIFIQEQNEGYSLTNNRIHFQPSSNFSRGNMAGIASMATNDTLKIINNTIYLASTSHSQSASYTYLSMGTTASYLRNNILYNQRSGNGKQYILGLPLNKNSFLTVDRGADYNMYVTRDTSRIIEIDTTGRGWGYWKSVSADDKNSSIFSNTTVPADSLFNSTFVAWLTINTNKSTSWLVNGRGIAGKESDFLAQDYSGDARSVTCGVGIDLGAEEFTPNAAVKAPDLVITGNHQLGGTEYFWSGGRLVAQITWGNQGSLPTFQAGTAKMYTGTYPEGGNLGAKRSNAYWFIEPSGGNGFTYQIKLYYNAGIQGNITSREFLSIAKRPINGGWVQHASCQADTVEGTVTICQLNSFSEFALSDDNLPLPLELVHFGAQKDHKNARINWLCANEKDIYKYIVMYSEDGKDWKEIYTTNAKGNLQYVYTHPHTENTPVTYYRLDYEEADGVRKEGPQAYLLWETENMTNEIKIWPNPCTNYCQFEFPGVSEVQIELVNLEGKVCNTRHIYSTDQRKFTVEFPDELGAGMYLLRIQHPTGTLTQRLMRQR